ncbi:MAG: PaaI family thioesterase [Alphaproteobacteria bacterium]|jgi:acyl-coenzyme A thioesterase PaaI-like protein|nr:PaaI family thioesterase [Alphaproteobacteria bacterium]MDP6567497.1 PaaI family thioesterase [Alphaproteobacteria bacterium]MDP6813342.1 PaaI family thioesterase [Alphaproteobacteria bacterium]|tara:strand:- start:107 stop:514 length:408 start_codon:yes stop_codon:yes gene_type:complete
MASEVPAGFEPVKESETFEGFVGPLYERRNGADYACGFRAAPHHVNGRGVVHAGMLSTFTDHTLGNLVEQAAERPCATISLNMDYLAGAHTGDWIECSGRVTRQTRSLVFIKGQLSVDGELVMTASGVWKKLGAD